MCDHLNFHIGCPECPSKPEFLAELEEEQRKVEESWNALPEETKREIENPTMTVIEYGCGCKYSLPKTEELVELLNNDPTCFLESNCGRCNDLALNLLMEKMNDEHQLALEELEAEMNVEVEHCLNIEHREFDEVKCDGCGMVQLCEGSCRIVDGCVRID